MSAPDKRMSEEEVVARLWDGMTLGIGGWGSRRKPMSLVRAICRSPLKDLTVVSYGGPDVGLLLACGKVRRLVYGFVSLDSIPLEPHFRRARQSGAVEAMSLDEGMLQLGLRAAAWRLPFLPVRAGPGSDVMAANPALKLVRSPYPAGFDALGADRGADRGADDEPGELLAAVPALKLDAALLHMNRADRAGNAAFLGPDLYFDDLFAAAADATYLSTTRLVDNAALGDAGPTRMRIHRMWIQGVVESPLGAHFTDCEPDHRRDETFQQLYAATAKSAAAWEDFRARFIDLPDEAAYREAVARWRAS